MDNRYLKEKYNRVKTASRLRLGVQQLIQRPYLNIFTLLILGSFPMLRKIIDESLLHMGVEKQVFPIFKICLQTIEIVFPIILLIYLVQMIGERTARKDEANIIVAFTNVKMFNQPPILISKKKDRKRGVMVREFYSNQAKHIWEEKMSNIEDAFSGRLVGEKIEYGGKNHSDGKKIVMYLAKGRQAKDWGTMYE